MLFALDQAEHNQPTVKSRRKHRQTPVPASLKNDATQVYQASTCMTRDRLGDQDATLRLGSVGVSVIVFVGNYFFCRFLRGQRHLDLQL